MVFVQLCNTSGQQIWDAASMVAASLCVSLEFIEWHHGWLADGVFNVFEPVWQIDATGNVVLDAVGNPVPTYDSAGNVVAGDPVALVEEIYGYVRVPVFTLNGVRVFVGVDHYEFAYSHLPNRFYKRLRVFSAHHMTPATAAAVITAMRTIASAMKTQLGMDGVTSCVDLTSSTNPDLTIVDPTGATTVVN